MEIKKVIVGTLKTNCYIILENRKAIIIDPGDDAGIILKKVGNAAVEKILITHAHFDHINATKEIKEKTGCKVGVYFSEKKILEKSNGLFEFSAVPVKADFTFKDRDIINFEGNSIEVIHTSGHTLGSVCFYIKDKKVLFSGDTLFRHGIGRTDLPESSEEYMLSSLKRILSLPDETRVLPGHGEQTTIKEEKIYLGI